MELQEALDAINQFKNRLVGRDRMFKTAIETVVNELNRLRSNLIRWEEDFDNDDNSIWTASSPHMDDDVSFKWRLQPGLLGNRIVWLADHDAELGGDGNQWDSLEEAKAAIQILHDEIIDAQKRELESAVADQT